MDACKNEFRGAWNITGGTYFNAFDKEYDPAILALTRSSFKESNEFEAFVLELLNLFIDKIADNSQDGFVRKPTSKDESQNGYHLAGTY
jgi:hypothetical protein